MKTILEDSEFFTLLTAADRKKLARIVTLFKPLVKLEAMQHYQVIPAEKTWLFLVGQVCNMGSALHLERIHSDPAMQAEFEEAVSLKKITHQRNQVAYLARILRNFSATRFPKRGAEKLVAVLNSPSSFRGRKVILFDGLSHKVDSTQTRDELIKRCPIFRLKSASDFMISVGLSRDVIALDTRVIGALQRYLGYNLTPGYIQSHREAYLSVEAALKEFCHEQNISLALLDRLLFRFSNMRAIELAIKYPMLLNQQ